LSWCDDQDRSSSDEAGDDMGANAHCKTPEFDRPIRPRRRSDQGEAA
jgi:hypothetical protein